MSLGNNAGTRTAGPGRWYVFWRLLRPHTLTASVIPVMTGTAVALLKGPVDYRLFFGMLLASVIIQSATNMFNEYYDYKKGLDNPDSVGIGGAIVRYGVQAGTVLRLALAFCFVALMIGVYLCYRSTWWLAPIGMICILVGYLYTGGPYPIAYTPFGELVAGFFMGAVIVLISFFIQVHQLGIWPVLAAVPQTVLIGAILLANNIRDLDRDREKGRRTLPVLLGRTGAIRLLAAMLIFSYLWIVPLLGLMTPWLALVFLSVPQAVRAVSRFSGRVTPAQMMPAMQACAQTNTLFGLMIVLAMILQAGWVPRRW